MNFTESKYWEPYTQTMEKLQEVITFQNATTEAYNVRRKIKKDLAPSFDDKNPFSKEDEKKFREATRAMIQAHHYPILIYKMSIVYAVSIFEIYLNDLVADLFRTNPKSLITGKKTMSYEEILSNKSMSKLVEGIISRELHEFSYKSISEKFSFLESKFKMNFPSIESGMIFFDDNIDYGILTEIFSARNLIIHTDSVVNEIYLKLNPKTKYKKGQSLKINFDYAFNSIFFLMQIVSKLYWKMKEKNEKQKTVKPA